MLLRGVLKFTGSGKRDFLQKARQVETEAGFFMNKNKH